MRHPNQSIVNWSPQTQNLKFLRHNKQDCICTHGSVQCTKLTGRKTRDLAYSCRIVER